MTQRSLLRLLLLGVLVLMSMLAWQLRQSYESAVQRVMDSAGNLSVTLHGQLTAAMRRIDSNLANIASQLPARSLAVAAGPAERKRLHLILRRYAENFPEVSGFFVWTPEGDLVATSDSIAPEHISIADRPGYLELRKNPLAPITFSDAIVSRYNGQRTVAVYAPLRDARGRLLAVVTATLSINRIVRSLETLQLPPGSVIFMRRSDNHKLVLRYPHLDSEVNKTVRNPIQRRIDEGHTSGRERFDAVTDGLARLYGFRKLDGYPYYVVVGLSEDGALASWRQSAQLVVAGLVVLGAALFALIWYMGRVERQRVAAQQDAAMAHELLQEAINSISAGITIYDSQDRMVACNEAHLRIFEGIRDTIQPGRTFEEITRAGVERGEFPEAAENGAGWLAKRLRQHQQADGQPHELALRDGRWIQFSEHRTPKGYTVGSRIDITDRKRLEEELREQASTDALTGLPNRRHFRQRLDEELERVRRRTTREACLLMLDLDHFKKVNDQYGHAAGDSLLRHFADLLRQELRATDTAGRMGGEEFAVILPGSSMASALGFAQRICDRLAGRPLHFGAQQLHVTVSVGIAAIAMEDLSADAVLSRADAALYRAKNGGRNQVQLA